MKTILTLKQRLDRDRVRKQHYRETMRARGFIQHTVWSSPEAWSKLTTLASAVGPGLILQAAARTEQREESPANVSETVTRPAHLSDKTDGDRSP